MTTRHMHASRARSLLFAAVLGVAISACPSPSSREPANVVNARIVDRWLTCEECIGGELDSVRSMGRALAPLLISALGGAPDSVLRNMALSSGESFARARQQFARLSPVDQPLRPLSDSGMFVAAIVANFQLTYRLRAARALDAVGRDSARVVFRRQLIADSLGARPPFGPILRRYLDSLASAPP